MVGSNEPRPKPRKLRPIAGLLDETRVVPTDHGQTRLGLSDTVGHATPDGVRNLLRFTRGIAPKDELVTAIADAAKASAHVRRDEDVMDVVHRARA